MPLPPISVEKRIEGVPELPGVAAPSAAIIEAEPRAARRNYFWAGGASVWIGARLWCLRAPWNPPLFSERYGFHDMKFRFAGWRLFVRNTGGR